MISYCLPIIKKTKEEVWKTIVSNKNYDYIEVWLDYVLDKDEVFVEKLLQSLGERLILLFRRQQLDQIHMDLSVRKRFLELLHKTNAYVDLDIMQQKEEIDYAASNNLKIQTILSYHNYQETPNKNRLEKIVKEMKKYDPTMYKIATYCNSQTDALRLLHLLLQLKENKLRCIILGMGKNGIITRIFGNLWGNEMIFAPIKNKDQSAPGQLTKTELEKIFNILITNN